MFARGSFVHQKCSNYTLTNLLFGLCKSMWIIDMFFTLPSPHPEAPTLPFTPKCCEARGVPQLLILPLCSTLDLELNLSRSLGVHQSWCSPMTSMVKFWQHLCRKFIKNDVALKRWLYFCFVELNIFINLLHLAFKPPIPHSTLTLKLALFLLWLSPRFENLNLKKHFEKLHWFLEFETQTQKFWNPNMKP
jgi:hypothetical protein